ncbi:MAG: hypothetical protein GY820_18765, partial [Gammaproteobacteria bacterium]|nr:hypothetical protein [Gammaproteobacteria bacterium]
MSGEEEVGEEGAGGPLEKDDAPDLEYEKSNSRELLLKEMEKRSVNCLSSVRSLLSQEGNGSVDEIHEINCQLKKVELQLGRLKGEGMQLEQAKWAAESAVMTRQRDQDQIELHKRKKRGERRRAD